MELDYKKLNRTELLSCKEALISLRDNCGYPRMLDEYNHRITMINFILKGVN